MLKTLFLNMYLSFGSTQVLDPFYFVQESFKMISDDLQTTFHTHSHDKYSISK